jgi:hypothetical protein
MSSYWAPKPAASHRFICHRNYLIINRLWLTVNFPAVTPGTPVSPPTCGPRPSPRGVRHSGSGSAGTCSARLADQHGVHRTDQSDDPPACGRSWPARHHALQTRGRRTPAVGRVSDVSELLLARCQPTPAFTAAPADPRDGLGQTGAALYTGDGGTVDRPRLDLAGDAPVPGTAVAATTGAVSGG